MNSIGSNDFDYIRALLSTQAAIVLDQGKEYLVEARLTPLARRHGFETLAGMIAEMRRNPGSPLHAHAVEALTTNETYFFRDFHPFEAIRRTILPELIARRSRTRHLAIWCAACSTGQEPYSLAMLIREHFPQLNDWKIEILATDLSTNVLKQAETGRYNQIEINRGLPAAYLAKYFTQQEGHWFIKPAIRWMVQFQALNLAQAWPTLPQCDLIFIRNVMIYFDVQAKRSILKRLRQTLHADGTLFLGSSETTINLDPTWAAVPHPSTVVYRPACAERLSGASRSALSCPSARVALFP